MFTHAVIGSCLNEPCGHTNISDRGKYIKVSLVAGRSCRICDVLGPGYPVHDSSHIIHRGKDVLFIYQQILPMLAKGVLIQIHDIFTPRHYRQDWLNKLFRFRNEQYLLEAFLYQNQTVRIRYSLNHLAKDHPADATKMQLHLKEGDEPSSSWMEKMREGNRES